MTVNPYTLENLYYKGVIPCVPYDLCMPSPMTPSGVAEMAGMSSMPQAGSLKQSFGMSGIGAQGAYGMENNYGVNGYQGMNGSQYLDMAMKGDMYGNYGSSYDSFVRSNDTSLNQYYNSNYSAKRTGNGNRAGSQYNFANAAYGINSGIGTDVDFERMANDKDGQDLRIGVTNAISSTKETVLNSPSWVKGLLSAGVILGTLVLLVKGIKKKPATPPSGGSFWSKLNPKNWFKK